MSGNRYEQYRTVLVKRRAMNLNLAERQDFVCVDVNERGLLDQVGSDDQSVLFIFSHQLSAKSGERTSDHLHPRTFREVIVRFDESIRAGQSLERKQLFVRDRFRLHDTDDADDSRGLKHCQAVRKRKSREAVSSKQRQRLPNLAVRPLATLLGQGQEGFNADGLQPIAHLLLVTGMGLDRIPANVGNTSSARNHFICCSGFACNRHSFAP